MPRDTDPSALGFCPERLAHVTNHLQRYVDDGRLPGWHLSIQRAGRTVLDATHGHRDLARKRAVQPDTLFRIYSMTKPITSVALMTLYEQGRFQLDDPIERFIPEFANLQVFASGDAAHYEVAPLERSVTVRDLLTHTAGFTYGFMHAHPVDEMYRNSGVGGVATQGTLADMVTTFGRTPLLFQPGSRWSYSVATDICGHLVEVLSGQSLDDFLQAVIFDPLDMRDTGFHVPAAQAERFASCYQRSGDGFELVDDAETSPYLKPPAFLSGGGGLVSTARDYLRFCTMLLGQGALGDARILGRRTLELMSANHLPTSGDLTSMGQAVFSETRYDGIGFGLGFSVVLDPARAQVSCSVGELAWGGMASTAFWVDPREELAVTFMTQLIPSSAWPIRRELRSLVYSALVD